MEIRDVRERNTLVVRTRTPVAELSSLIGTAYGEVMGYMSARGLSPAGAPFVVYHNMDIDDLDVEMGFPVPSPAEGNGSVIAGKLPGGKVGYARHVGPYEEMHATYDALAKFVTEKGYTPESFVYEVYLNAPDEVPPEKLETEIYFPLKQ